MNVNMYSAALLALTSLLLLLFRIQEQEQSTCLPTLSKGYSKHSYRNKYEEKLNPILRIWHYKQPERLLPNIERCWDKQKQ